MNIAKRFARWYWGWRWWVKWPVTVVIGLTVLGAALGEPPEDPETASAGVTSTAEPTETAAPSPTATATATATASPTATRTPTATTSRTPTATPTPEPTPDGMATVTNIVDGDTIDVVVGGEEIRVRLILIDTPEVHSGVECGGPEASAFVRGTISPGTSVRLERDVSETDRYGRALRYVYLEDGTMLNELVVREGYGVVSTYPPDVTHVDVIRAAEREARGAGRGLWTLCADTPTPAPAAPAPPAPPAIVPFAPPAPPAPPAAAPTQPPPPPAAPAGNCDPSYPGVCIPPAPPDLDCGEIPFRRFQVLQPDPHGFDRDRDGVGCESG